MLDSIIWELIISGYILLFMGGLIALRWWRKRQRKEKPPLKFELLRAPGEALQERVQSFEENLFLWIPGVALFPLLTGCTVFQAIRVVPAAWHGAIAWFSLAVAILSFFAGARWLWLRLDRWRNDWLGYLGERMVAEHLQPLIAAGYAVFHDLPASGANEPFNLDHVVVGPAGIAVVETKARRKGKARPGTKEHVVIYDGSRLIWPWGEEVKCLSQALAEAAWLRAQIKQRTGLSVEVRAIVAIPGWWVEQTARGNVTVVNPKVLPQAVRGRGERLLTGEQIATVARYLDSLGRKAME